MDAKKQSQQSYGSKKLYVNQIQAIENEKFKTRASPKQDQTISTKIKVTVLI
jgi:hypothetical protein